jgi:hypothetical protein
MCWNYSVLDSIVSSHISRIYRVLHNNISITANKTMRCPYEYMRNLGEGQVPTARYFFYLRIAFFLLICRGTNKEMGSE